MFHVNWLELLHFVHALIGTCMHSQLTHPCHLQILAAKLGWSVIVGFITCYALVRLKVSYLFINNFPTLLF